MNVTYNFEYERLDDEYKDVLIEIYSDRIRRLIFEDCGQGFTGVDGEGLIKQHCIGCQYQCSSQKHHNLCLLPYEVQIEELIDYAFGGINEIEITAAFEEHVSKSSKLHSLGFNSPHKHLLDGEWRQNIWLNEFVVRMDIINRVVCLQYFIRKSLDEGKETDAKG